MQETGFWDALTSLSADTRSEGNEPMTFASGGLRSTEHIKLFSALSPYPLPHITHQPFRGRIALYI